MKRILNLFARRTVPSPIEKKPSSIKLKHGAEITDDYFWLKNHDIEHPPLKEYISKENQYFDAYFKHTNAGKYCKQIEKEFIGLVESNTITDTAEYANGYYYHVKYVRGSDYPVYCRKKEMKGKSQTILDVNEEAKGHNYISVKKPILSVDGELVAYAKSPTDDNYTGIIRRVADKAVLSKIPLVYSMIFSRDNKYVIYTKPDKLRRPCQVYCHKIGTDSKDDILLLEENNAEFFVDVTRSKDNKLIMIVVTSKDTSEVWIMDSAAVCNPNQLILIQKRSPGVKYFIDHADNQLFCVTNVHNCLNFKLLSSSTSSLFNNNRFNLDFKFPAFDNQSFWKERIPHSDKHFITEIDIFAEYLVCYLSSEGNYFIEVYNIKDLTAKPYKIPLPSSIDKKGVVEPGGNLDYHSKILRFTFSSPLIPTIVYDYSLETKQLKVVSKADFGINTDEYECFRISNEKLLNNLNAEYLKSPNIDHPPITIIRKRNIGKPGPVLLDVYGAYGQNIDPHFRIDYFPLLQRGWTIAVIHTRGGSEYGPSWHKYGSAKYKQNSINDFINAARYLITNQIVDSKRVCAHAQSAGGLLLGAACNQQPTLFNSVIMKVPFVDCLSSMIDETLPLTVHEYPEWGNPNDNVDDFMNITNFDPYQNITANPLYPSFFVTTSTIDFLVPFYGPVKWTSKMRELNNQYLNSKKVLLLKVDDDVGHGGENGLYSGYMETAKEYAFLLHQTEINKKA